jgi:hypothetical protein
MRPNLVQSVEPVSDPRGCVGESQGLPVYTKPCPDSTRCTAHWTPANTRILVRKLPQILTVSSTLVHSYTQSLLFSINHLLKQPEGILRSTPTPWCVVCVQCKSLNGISWESWDWFLSQNCRIRAGLFFKNRGRLYLHVPQLYRKLLLKV